MIALVHLGPPDRATATSPLAQDRRPAAPGRDLRGPADRHAGGQIAPRLTAALDTRLRAATPRRARHRGAGVRATRRRGIPARRPRRRDDRGRQLAGELAVDEEGARRRPRLRAPPPPSPPRGPPPPPPPPP